MSEILNEHETSSESKAHSEEQEDSASWERYMEKKSLVLEILHSNLNLHHLQHQQSKVELLKKCCFYLEIEPKHVNVIDENDVILRTDIFQLIDPCHFQKMKEVGKKQTEVLLALLTELLEQLEQGRQELSCYIQAYDMRTFLSQWDLIKQRLFKLSQYMETLLSLHVPGRLYVKHPLMSHTDFRSHRVPNIRLSLCTKMPLIFDREESVARKDCAKLKWFTGNPESQVEQYELYFQLVTGSQAEMGHGRSQVVTSDTCVVQNLQPGSIYEFTIRRSVTQTFVWEKWHDSIVLRTKT
ncbi:fibronectin type III domain-containing protein 11 [Aegotheles albertisi]